MPNRGQTQDQGTRGRNPGTLPPDDDETVQSEDNPRQAQDQQKRQRRQENPGDEGTEIQGGDIEQEDADDDDVSQ